MRREEKPTRCHWMVYCTYNMLSVFRAHLCPSSGARDYMCVITVYGVQCLVAGCRKSGAGQQAMRTGRGMLQCNINTVLYESDNHQNLAIYILLHLLYKLAVNVTSLWVPVYDQSNCSFRNWRIFIFFMFYIYMYKTCCVLYISVLMLCMWT